MFYSLRPLWLSPTDYLSHHLLHFPPVSFCIHQGLARKNRHSFISLKERKCNAGNWFHRAWKRWDHNLISKTKKPLLYPVLSQRGDSASGVQGLCLLGKKEPWFPLLHNPGELLPESDRSMERNPGFYLGPSLSSCPEVFVESNQQCFSALTLSFC